MRLRERSKESWSEARPQRLDDAPATVDAWLDVFGRLLRLPGAQRDAIRDELRSHLTDRVRDLMLAGADRDDAMRQAVHELGDTAELAEQFVRANRYPRRRLIMQSALIGLGAAAVVAVAAVFTAGGAPSMEPAVFQSKELRANQIETLKTIRFTVTTDMTPRQIVGEIADSNVVGVSIDWGSLEEIGVEADTPLGLSGESLSAFQLLGELSRRYGDSWDGIDWRLNDRMLVIDRRMAFDLRERMMASYDVDPILAVMQHRYDVAYEEAKEQIANVVQELIEPEQWEAQGGNVAQLRIVGGRMFVQAPLRMHEKVSWILGELAKTGAVDDEHAGRPGLAPSIMPELSKEERAQHEQNQIAMARLRNIYMGWQIFAQRDEGEPLHSLQQLVDQGMLPANEIRSPHGPARDGRDYWLDFANLNPEVEDWSKRILGIDRAMYESADSVATLFADGHIELLSIARFHAMLEHTLNEGVKPDLPERRDAAAEQNRLLERYTLAHADAQEIGNLLIETLGGDAEIAVDARSNTLMVTAPAIRLSRWDALLNRLDTPVLEK